VRQAGKRLGRGRAANPGQPAGRAGGRRQWQAERQEAAWLSQQKLKRVVQDVAGAAAAAVSEVRLVKQAKSFSWDDVIIKKNIFGKKIWQKLAFSTQNIATLSEKCIITLGLKKHANFLLKIGENRRNE
jgi:hypothetical protein